MKITKELIEKYYLGKCSEEERLFVERWMKSSEDEESKYTTRAIRKLKRETWEEIKLTNKSSFLEADQAYVRQTESRKQGRIISLNTVTRRYAAVLLLCILSFSAYFTYNFYAVSENTQVADLYQTVTTLRGEKRTVTLSDGSTIKMNYETEIRIPEQFEGNQRVVYLTGHAHFDVARDTERPFIIYTEDSKTQVLGTSFGINTKEQGKTEIIVTSGRVAFSEKDQSDNLVTLTVNDKAILNPNKSITTYEVEAKKLTAWKENRLAFYDQTVTEIIGVIEPWYDVKVTITNPDLLSREYTFVYDNPSLELLIERMSILAKFEYRIEGKRVIIE